MSEINYSTSMYLGHGRQGGSAAVFYSPLTGVWNNKPPGTVITGAPGSGKTFAAQFIVATQVMIGGINIVIDPKGDFLSLVNIKDEIGEFNLWNLADTQGKAGMLDPFNMSESPETTRSLVVNLISIFTGGLTDNELRILSPIIGDVIKLETPSLQRVVDLLRGNKEEIAKNLGTKLNLIRKMKYSKLCFASGVTKSKKFTISSGLTIITMAGMKLPKTDNDLTNLEGRLVSGLLYLITDFVRNVMEKDVSEGPKSITIDEALGILSTPYGRDMIESVALLGRSKGFALTLIAQNSKHIKKLDIENTISSRLAFNTDYTEAKEIVKDMNLPEGFDFENILIGLGQGECLYQDWQGNYSIIQIDVWKEKWRKAFETNPLKKLLEKQTESE